MKGLRKGFRPRIEKLESREVFATVPLTFSQMAPEGWMIFDSQVGRELIPGEADRLTANLAIGQSISLAINSSADLTARLVDPNNLTIAQLVIPAGQVTYINPFVANTPGTWSIVLAAPSNASAIYTADVALNSGLEGRDSTAADPRPLDATVFALPTGVTRWAFMGVSDTRKGPDIDYYSLSLSNRNEKPISIKVVARNGQDLSGQRLEIVDSNGLVRAIASPKSGQWGVLEIPNYLVTSSGKYTLRFTSAVAGAYSLVVSDGVVDKISASAILNEMVTRRLVTPSSVSALLDTLSFDRVFQSLSPESLLELLVKRELVGRVGDAATLRALLVQQGVDLTSLRPDGVLAALATANGETLLKFGNTAIDAAQAKLYLQSAFQSDKSGFLNVFTTKELVELFDDSIDPSIGAIVDPIRIIVDKTIPAGYSNITVSYRLWSQDSGVPDASVTPSAAVQATNAMPNGARALFLTNFLELLGYGGGISAGGYVDPMDASGRRTQNYLVWMDSWQVDASARLSSFLAEYKQRGGALDYLLIDIEDTSFSYWSMRTTDRRVDPLQPATKTVWEELLSDSRWPALRHQLLSRGIPESELTLQRISAWDIHSDYAARWNAVMEERLADYLNRAITDAVLRLYPDATIANYGNYYRTQVVPSGKYDEFRNSYYSLGSLVGNAQSRANYGYAEDVTTPAGSSDPHRQFNARIKSIRFIQDYDSQGRPLASGVSVVSFFNPVNDVRPGDQVIIENREARWIDERYTGHFTVDSISPDGLTLKYRMPLSGDSLPMAYDLSHRAQAELTAYVDFTRSYERFVSEVKSLRTQVAASSVAMLPWVSNSDWLKTDLGITFDHYGETLLHAMLSGADAVLWWKDGWDPQPQNTAKINQLVAEANALIGYSDRRTISFDSPAWQDGYVMTGMEANGRRVYRFTPDPTTSVGILSNSNTVRIQVNGAVIEIPNAYIYTPASPASNLGFWIVQTAGPTSLRGSVDQVLSQVERSLMPQIIGSTASLVGATTSFSLDVITNLLPVNTLLSFDIDWTGDGKIDNTYIGYSGQQIAAVYSVAGSYTVRVHTSIVGSDERLPTLELPVRILSPGLYAESGVADAPVKNLVFAGTNADDTVFFQSVEAGVVDVFQPLGGKWVTRRFTGITGGIYAYGMGGNDILVAVNADVPVWLYGGDGNDTLVGGKILNQLYGELGNDIFVPGMGQNLLVGGPGVDRAYGNDGSIVVMPSDILVGINGRLAPIESQYLDAIKKIFDSVNRSLLFAAAAIPRTGETLSKPRALFTMANARTHDACLDLDENDRWL